MLGTVSRLIKSTLTIWLYVMAYPVIQAWFVRASFFTHDLTLEDWRVLRFKMNVDGHKCYRVIWCRKLTVITADNCECVVSFHYVLANTSFVGFLSAAVDA